jgi:hypothetical protein
MRKAGFQSEKCLKYIDKMLSKRPTEVTLKLLPFITPRSEVEIVSPKNTRNSNGKMVTKTRERRKRKRAIKSCVYECVKFTNKTNKEILTETNSATLSENKSGRKEPPRKHQRKPRERRTLIDRVRTSRNCANGVGNRNLGGRRSPNQR